MEDIIPSQEVVAVNNQSLVDSTDDIIASAERRIAHVQKILEMSLKVTKANDWVDQNGKPYLMGSGAEKIARLFAVSWKDIKSEKIHSEDETGKFYFYQVSGVFNLKKDSILAIGIRSSKDKFFARSGGKLKELSEIDEPNIAKAAYTNCVVNGVTRLLGLRGLDWETVEKAGMRKDTVSSVSYKQGTPGKEDENSTRQKLRDCIMQMVDQDMKRAAEKIEILSTFTNKDGDTVKGKRHEDYLSGKWLMSTYGKAKTEYKKQFGEEYSNEPQV